MSSSPAMLSCAARSFAARSSNSFHTTPPCSPMSAFRNKHTLLSSICNIHSSLRLSSRSFATNQPDASSSGGHPASYVVTTAGPDRPGIVHTIASHLSSLGANIEESRMTVLGGDFAVILRITTPPSTSVDSLTSSLSRLFPSFLVAARPTSHSPPLPSPSHILTISIEGPDQPGVVAAFTAALRAAHNTLSIRDLDTDTSSAPFAGYKVFSLRCVVAVSGAVGREGVREKLEEFEQKWGFDVVIEEDGMEERLGEEGEAEEEEDTGAEDREHGGDAERGRHGGRPQRR